MVNNGMLIEYFFIEFLELSAYVDYVAYLPRLSSKPNLSNDTCQ
jgi:hypothetical protein